MTEPTGKTPDPDDAFADEPTVALTPPGPPTEAPDRLPEPADQSAAQPAGDGTDEHDEHFNGDEPRADALADAGSPDEHFPEAREPYQPMEDNGSTTESAEAAESAEPPHDPAQAPAGVAAASSWIDSLNKVSGARVVIALLVGLLGFTLVAQWKHNTDDGQYASARQEDLLRFLADLDAREERLRQDILALQETKSGLDSDTANQDKILTEAQERADDLGILAGTEPAQGPGITVRFWDGSSPIKASHLLDAVQELRNAGAEALQVDAGGQSVRIIASTYFSQDSDGSILVDGVRLTGPYVITAIGNAETMSKALKIPGGVITRVLTQDGNVIVNEPGEVDVKTVRPTPDLEYAKPVA